MFTGVMIFVLMGITGSSQAPAAEGIPIPDASAYRLKYLMAQADFEALRMQTVIQNFIQSNQQVKDWNDSANRIAAGREECKVKLFKDAGLDVNVYIIDAAAGQFVKRK
mgnify:CR=1 FL=1